MKLGISFNCYRDLDDETQFALMKENGFEATMIGSEYERLDEVVKKLRAQGLVCENLHGPASTESSNINDLWRDKEASVEMLARVMDGLEKCSRYEIPTMVLHVTAGPTPPRPNKRGYERFVQIFDRARELGVKIACENIRPFGNLAFILEQFPEARFCWDVGHEAYASPGRQFMPLFGCQLGALHIHDNNLEADEHMLPYDGKIDFDRVARQIAETDYEGSLMLEVIRSNHTLYDSFTPAQYYARAGEAAKRLEAQIAHYRKLRA